MADESPEMKCDVCNRRFTNAIALEQHKLDRHGVGDAKQLEQKQKETSHTAKTERKAQIEASRESQRSDYRKQKAKRRTMIYTGLAVVLLAIIVIAMTLPPSDDTPKEDDILAGLALPGFNDHWHARYEIELCGEVQPDSPPSDGGVHSHGDGQFHIHPQNANEVGEKATMGLFFQSTNVQLKADSITLDNGTVWRNGDACPDSTLPGTLMILVNGQELVHATPERYVPQDGDLIRIIFD